MGRKANPKKREELLFWFGYPGLPSTHASMGGAPWAILLRPSGAFSLAR